jgi:hypothetical protein
MQINENSSDYDIDLYARDYVEKHIAFIKNNIPSGWRDDSGLGLRALKELLLESIKKSCYSFINNKHDTKYLAQYLFPTLKHSCKSVGRNLQNKKSYSCPCCMTYNKSDKFEPVQILPDYLICNNCTNVLNNTKYVWEDYLYTTFAKHSKSGYKCGDCKRFIPDNNKQTIKCPYIDCMFVGTASEMEVMPHPRFRYSFEDAIVDGMQLQSKSKTDSKLLIQENMEEYIKILNECIDEQIGALEYKGHNITLINKKCMYMAYRNLVKTHPQEMISYLVFTDRGLHIQSKIFQEFISILEHKLPVEYISRGEKHIISSLMDKKLSIFSGISKFKASVDEKREIANNTQEIYVGGRKASYCRPYYMGKIIDITNVDTDSSIFKSIKEYSFSKIKMSDDVDPGVNVLVEHMYIPPHYQMGGMVYLNRIRRSIVDKVYYRIHGRKRKINAQSNNNKL